MKLEDLNRKPREWWIHPEPFPRALGKVPQVLVKEKQPGAGWIKVREVLEDPKP